MKRFVIFTLAVAMFVGMNFGTTVAASQTSTDPIYNDEQQIDNFIRDIIKQLFGHIPVQLEKPSKSNVIPSPSPKPVQKQPASQPPVTQTQNLSTQEQQMVNLVNQERQKQGLAPLKVNMDVVKVARAKAKDMIDKNYFDHTSPTYGSPAEMLNKFGVSYRTMGENLAGNSSVQGAHQGLMNSSGHRANILNNNFTEVGIGIVNGGPYGKMFVQLFIGK